MPSMTISEVEVSLVSNQGFWLLADDEELFLSYADFPWFKEATIAQITQVERPSRAPNRKPPVLAKLGY